MDNFLDEALEEIKLDGIPIFVSEFGGNCEDWVAAAINVLQEREDYLTLGAYWTYKGIYYNDGTAIAYNMDDTDDWDRLIEVKLSFCLFFFFFSHFLICFFFVWAVVDAWRCGARQRVEQCVGVAAIRQL